MWGSCGLTSFMQWEMYIPPLFSFSTQKASRKAKLRSLFPNFGDAPNSGGIPLDFSLPEVQLPPAWRIQG